MEEGTALLLALVVMSFCLGMLIWTFSRSRQMLERWAADNSYEILSSQLRWLRKGPFFWTSSKGQVVYYVAVRTPEGHTKRGWVRRGSFWREFCRTKCKQDGKHSSQQSTAKTRDSGAVEEPLRCWETGRQQP